MGMALFFARPAQVHVAAGLSAPLTSRVHPLPRPVVSFNTLLRCYPSTGSGRRSGCFLGAGMECGQGRLNEPY